MLGSFSLDPLVAGKSPKDTTVVVAMSGGVDSSVVSALLHKLGYKVIGVTMQLYSGPETSGKSCCGSVDIKDAKRVASMLGFPHYVLDYEKTFQDEVIQDFITAYKHGETPIPCIKCNQTVKFRDLLKTARAIGGDVVATGHYVRRIETDGEQQLWAGVDKQKDQSYFLFSITAEQLRFVRFPLGNFVKNNIRTLARYFSLDVADKPDSQDICFVSGNYRETLRNLDSSSMQKGAIVHVDGRVLGQHNGIVNFTVGQRRGLGTSSTSPLYVVKLDAQRNEVIVGPQSSLVRRKLRVRNLNWLPKSAIPASGLEVDVRLRSSCSRIAATIFPEGQSSGMVILNGDHVISPGQACVAYDNDRMLGGGWISQSDL